MAGATFVVMDTWRMGRRVHLDAMRDNALALDLFLERADKFSQRIAGTAVFLAPAAGRGAQCPAAQPEALQGAA